MNAEAFVWLLFYGFEVGLMVYHTANVIKTRRRQKELVAALESCDKRLKDLEVFVNKLNN